VLGHFCWCFGASIHACAYMHNMLLHLTQLLTCRCCQHQAYSARLCRTNMLHVCKPCVPTKNPCCGTHTVPDHWCVLWMVADLIRAQVNQEMVGSGLQSRGYISPGYQHVVPRRWTVTMVAVALVPHRRHPLQCHKPWTLVGI
jgi:hypothetical protein